MLQLVQGFPILETCEGRSPPFCPPFQKISGEFEILKILRRFLKIFKYFE